MFNEDPVRRPAGSGRGERNQPVTDSRFSWPTIPVYLCLRVSVYCVCVLRVNTYISLHIENTAPGGTRPGEIFIRQRGFDNKILDNVQ